MKTTHLILVATLLGLATPSFAAKPGPQKSPEPTVGSLCSKPDTITNWLSPTPLICKDGKWTELTIPTPTEGSSAFPLVYNGESTISLENDQPVFYHVGRKAELLDISWPADWTLRAVFFNTPFNAALDVMPDRLKNVGILRIRPAENVMEAKDAVHYLLYFSRDSDPQVVFKRAIQINYSCKPQPLPVSLPPVALPIELRKCK